MSRIIPVAEWEPRDVVTVATKTRLRVEKIEKYVKLKYQ